MDHSTTAEVILRHRDHCLELARVAPTSEIRAKLLSLAHLYEIEAGLIADTASCITESKDLLARVESLVRPSG
jgi:hypothetical protein